MDEEIDHYFANGKLIKEIKTNERKRDQYEGIIPTISAKDCLSIARKVSATEKIKQSEIVCQSKPLIFEQIKGFSKNDDN